MLNPAIIARTLHKWLGLVVGVQLLIWLASGLYMVVVDIDFIHGDPLVKNMEQTVTAPGAGQLSMAMVRAQYPEANQISLRPVMGKTCYTVTTRTIATCLTPKPVHSNHRWMRKPPGKLPGIISPETHQ